MKRIVIIIILLIILGSLYVIRERQVEEARTKGYAIATQEAEKLGFDITKMSISKEILNTTYLIVSFKYDPQNTINDLEVWVECENIYDVELLGAFRDVDPGKDREKIAISLLKGSIEEFKKSTKELKDIFKKKE